MKGRREIGSITVVQFQACTVRQRGETNRLDGAVEFYLKTTVA